ncbi:MAG: hypothetical protein ACRD2I_25605 [Vicinamibacterales bacterium]
MPFRLSAAFLLALAGAISISCGGIVDPSQNTVDTFSGTVAPGGGSVQHFSAAKTGEITVKVLTLTPAAVPVLYVQWAGNGDGSCNGGLFQAGLGTANTTVISGQIVSGAYCVILSDYIGQTVTANYTITVSHP